MPSNNSSDVVTTILVCSCLLCAIWGGYVAGVCKRGTLEGVLHGFFLGPFGLILLALYPREEMFAKPPDKADRSEQILATIHAELKWQREQKEKEIVRAKAAQSQKRDQPVDGNR